MRIPRPALVVVGALAATTLAATPSGAAPSTGTGATIPPDVIKASAAPGHSWQRRPGEVQRRVEDEPAGHDEGRHGAARRRLLPHRRERQARCGHVPGAAHADALRQERARRVRQRGRPDRTEQLPRAARLHRRRCRRPRHGRLRGRVRPVRPGAGFRRRDAGELGREARRLERQGRHVRRVLPRHRPAAHRSGAAQGQPAQGDLPGRPRQRPVQGHRHDGRPDRHRVQRGLPRADRRAEQRRADPGRPAGSDEAGRAAACRDRAPRRPRDVRRGVHGEDAQRRRQRLRRQVLARAQPGQRAEEDRRPTASPPTWSAASTTCSSAASRSTSAACRTRGPAVRSPRRCCRTRRRPGATS